MDPTSEATALVLGATGRIGMRLTGRLLDHGWSVYGAARMSDAGRVDELEALGVRPIEYEVQEDDPSVLPDVDVLFLEIWDPSLEDRQWAINYHGVGRVVERYAGAADIVNGSTLEVYGRRADLSDEESPCRPTSPYGRSRYALERLVDFFCERSESRAIHLRYAYANSSRHGVIRHLAEDILEGRSLGSDPDARLQMIGYEDVVRITRKAAREVASPPRIVNCCHPVVWRKRKLAEAIHDRLGTGTVRFDAPTGGTEGSFAGHTGRMIECFGRPEVSVDRLITRVAEDLIGSADDR